MHQCTHLSVLSSVWRDMDLDALLQLRKESRKSEKWAVLTGGSWIKNQEKTEAYCKANGLAYELIGNLTYLEFLNRLSGYKGLVFHPAGFDTCPRLVIEAKIMGLELDLNENVQHQDEKWFKDASPDDIVKYLRDRPERFWSILLGKKEAIDV